MITQYQLLYEGWRGYLISGFALVWIANIYMSLYAFIRIDIKKEKIITKIQEAKVKAQFSSEPATDDGPAKPAFRTGEKNQINY